MTSLSFSAHISFFTPSFSWLPRLGPWCVLYHAWLPTLITKLGPVCLSRRSSGAHGCGAGGHPASKNQAAWTPGAFMAARGFAWIGLGTPGHPQMYSWGLWDLVSFKELCIFFQVAECLLSIWYKGDKTMNYSSVLFIFTQIRLCQSNGSSNCRGLQNLFPMYPAHLSLPFTGPFFFVFSRATSHGIWRFPG